MLNGIFFALMSVFRNIPFLRILIPFVTGILAAIEVFPLSTSLMVLGALLLLAIVFGLLKPATSSRKIISLLITDVFLFLLAMRLTNEARIPEKEQYFVRMAAGDSVTKMIAVIRDLPVEKTKTVKCELKILRVKKQGVYSPAEGTLIAYFHKPEGKSLREGQTLLLNTGLVEIEPPKNPGEFDYKAYMLNRQITHVCFPQGGAWSVLEMPSPLSPIWLLGLETKRALLDALKRSELDQNAFAICAALLTGYDDEIDRSVMQAFSHSGTLHVLSVSGLHTGLIFLVLSFLFDLFDRKRKQKLLKFIVITCFLWAFALLTGFSAPVLRAVIMFNLLGFGRIFFRNDYRNHINILLASAFILLCYQPFLIKDIGFLLSYLALLGILFFQPLFAEAWKPENKLLQSVWQNTTASFAATLTTLPLTLFYFKQFPLWFFICNLVVVPASFVILMLAILVLAKVGIAASLINGIIRFLMWFINWFDAPGLGYIDCIDFSYSDAVLLTFLILVLSLAFYYRSYTCLVISFCMVMFWQANGIISSVYAKNSTIVAVYHIPKEKVYLLKNNCDVSISTLNPRIFDFYVKPHLIRFNYPLIKEQKFNMVAWGKQTILFLDRKEHWPGTDLGKITTLVVSNNFRLMESDLEQFVSLKLIVADGSNNRFNIQNLEKLSSKFGLEFYSTQKGAFLTSL